MSWKTINRNESVIPEGAAPVLDEAVREKIRSFFDRYDTKKAVLLPALHIVQNTLGHVSLRAMVEVAEVLEIHPSEVMDTLSFYTHFWTHPKGEKVITVCRSISCELLGGKALLDELKNKLGIGEHETTPCGKYSLVTEECLAGCDHSPCMLINEKLHKCVNMDDLQKILDDSANDKVDMPRSDLFDAPLGSSKGVVEKEAATVGAAESSLDSTSDVQEMRDAD